MDADELSALPPEGSWRRSNRARTSSLNPRYAYTNPSPATTRAESPSRHPDTTTTTIHHHHHPHHHNNNPDAPIILAPTPRRHLLESSESQHWLHSPPLSPLTPSRGLSLSPSPSSQQSSLFTFPLPFPNISASSSLNNNIQGSNASVSNNTRTVRRKVSSSTRNSFSALHEHERLGTAPGSPGARRFSSVGLPPHTGNAPVHLHAGQRLHELEEPAMGRRWVRWMHKRGMKAWVVPGILAVSVLIKLAIGLGSYSGFGEPPMYGDYEAQRHWMELTIHLPMSRWYTYDLQYWGLDYPPLTAYVSWICGVVAHYINPVWVALDKSRGIETPESKVFMRMSVLVADSLVYIPALLLFAQTWQGSRSKRTQEHALLTLILQPALLLIDYGHFQYNSVMLGFTLLAMNFFATGNDLLGAFFFVLSLGFKQMALYYAPAIGSYLVAKCLHLGTAEGFRLFSRLALVTASTFILLFLPWLPPFASFSGILQPIRRIFPFARGLFEDKVANFWCASNVVFKWKAWGSPDALVKISTFLTAVGFLPAVVGLVRAGLKMQVKSEKKDDSATDAASREPTPFLPLLPYALLTSSMSFFLFSFQVHEKTILLPLMPLALLLSGAPVDSAVYSWGALVNNVAVFSMWPLLKRDGLGIQYLSTLLLWNRLIGYNPLRIPPKSFIQLLSMAVYAAALLLHLLEMMISPPLRYPDIYPVLNVLISTPVFFLTWLWSIKCGVEVGWAVGGLGTGRSESRPVPRRGSEVAGDVASGVSAALDAAPPAGQEGLNVNHRRLLPGNRAVSLTQRPTE